MDASVAANISLNERGARHTRAYNLHKRSIRIPRLSEQGHS